MNWKTFLDNSKKKSWILKKWEKSICHASQVANNPVQAFLFGLAIADFNDPIFFCLVAFFWNAYFFGVIEHQLSYV